MPVSLFFPTYLHVLNNAYYSLCWLYGPLKYYKFLDWCGFAFLYCYYYRFSGVLMDLVFLPTHFFDAITLICSFCFRFSIRKALSTVYKLLIFTWVRNKYRELIMPFQNISICRKTTEKRGNKETSGQNVRCVHARY